MLSALKSQLYTMSNDPKDPFTKQIRALVGAREAVLYEHSLRKIILLLPEMIGYVSTWSRETNSPKSLKRLHQYVLAYLYNPTDFLPEKVHGLFGYIDDAYLVGRIFEITLNETEWVGSESTPPQRLIDHIEEGVSQIQTLFPSLSKKVDRVIAQLYPGERRLDRLIEK